MHSRLYGLDHLRALAITLVFVFHYQILSAGQPEWMHRISGFGWTGVDLFFVLSGFLISSQLFSHIVKGEKISFKEFFLKRAFRILPAFLVVVAIYFWIPFFREKESLPPLWKFLTFTQNFGLNLHDSGTFSHAWSLCVEEHFYFFLPIILVGLQASKIFKNSYLLLIALFVFGFAIRIYSFNNLYSLKIGDDNSWVYWYKYIYYPTYNRLDGLLVGVGIAGIYQFSPNIWNKITGYGNEFIACSLLVLTGAYFLCHEAQSFNASIWGFPAVAFGYGLLVIGALSSNSFLYKWKSRTTSYIATLSYGIYLTHKGIIHMTQQLLANLKINENLMFTICLITCIFGAVLLNWTIEKPFMRLRNKVIKPKIKPVSFKNLQDNSADILVSI